MVYSGETNVMSGTDILLYYIVIFLNLIPILFTAFLP